MSLAINSGPSASSEACSSVSTTPPLPKSRNKAMKPTINMNAATCALAHGCVVRDFLQLVSASELCFVLHRLASRARSALLVNLGKRVHALSVFLTESKGRWGKSCGAPPPRDDSAPTDESEQRRCWQSGRGEVGLSLPFFDVKILAGSGMKSATDFC